MVIKIKGKNIKGKNIKGKNIKGNLNPFFVMSNHAYEGFLEWYKTRMETLVPKESVLEVEEKVRKKLESKGFIYDSYVSPQDEESSLFSFRIRYSKDNLGSANTQVLGAGLSYSYSCCIYDGRGGIGGGHFKVDIITALNNYSESQPSNHIINNVWSGENIDEVIKQGTNALEHQAFFKWGGCDARNLLGKFQEAVKKPELREEILSELQNRGAMLYRGLFGGYFL